MPETVDTVRSRFVKEMLVEFAIFMSPTWEPGNGDDIQAARALVSRFLQSDWAVPKPIWWPSV